MHEDNYKKRNLKQLNNAYFSPFLMVQLRNAIIFLDDIGYPVQSFLLGASVFFAGPADTKKTGLLN